MESQKKLIKWLWSVDKTGKFHDWEDVGEDILNH